MYTCISIDVCVYIYIDRCVVYIFVDICRWNDMYMCICTLYSSWHYFVKIPRKQAGFDHYYTHCHPGLSKLRILSSVQLAESVSADNSETHGRWANCGSSILGDNHQDPPAASVNSILLPHLSVVASVNTCHLTNLRLAPASGVSRESPLPQSRNTDVPEPPITQLRDAKNASTYYP